MSTGPCPVVHRTGVLLCTRSRGPAPAIRRSPNPRAPGHSPARRGRRRRQDRIAASPGTRRSWRGDAACPERPDTPVLVGIDAGATKAVAIAVTPDGERIARAEGPGANPKRHGLDTAADRIVTLARGRVEAGAPPSCSSPVPASIAPSTRVPSRPRSPTASRTLGSSSSTTRSRPCAPGHPTPWASRCRSRRAATSSGADRTAASPTVATGSSAAGTCWGPSRRAPPGAAGGRGAPPGGGGREPRLDRSTPRARGRAPGRRRRPCRRTGRHGAGPVGEPLVRPGHGGRAARRSTAWVSARSPRSWSTAACSIVPVARRTDPPGDPCRHARGSPRALDREPAEGAAQLALDAGAARPSPGTSRPGAERGPGAEAPVGPRR